MIRKILFAILPVILFAGVLNADDSYSAGYRILTIETSERTMNVTVWYPSNSEERVFDYKHSDRDTETKLALNGSLAEGKKFPLVIFSHGFGGCGHGSHWVKEEMARNGIITVSPDYNDKMNVCRIKDANHFTFGDPDVLTLLSKEEIDKMAGSISDYVTYFFKYTLEKDPQFFSILQKSCSSFTEYKFDLSCKE